MLLLMLSFFHLSAVFHIFVCLEVFKLLCILLSIWSKQHHITGIVSKTARNSTFSTNSRREIHLQAIHRHVYVSVYYVREHIILCGVDIVNFIVKYIKCVGIDVLFFFIRCKFHFNGNIDSQQQSGNCKIAKYHFKFSQPLLLNRQ